MLIGSSENVVAAPNMDALMSLYDIGSTTKSAAKFDPSELDGLNETIVHALDYSDVKARLSEAGVDVGDERAEAFWGLVRRNVKKVKDAGEWWPIATSHKASDATLDGEDLEFARAAFDALPDGNIDQNTWKMWTDIVKAQSGRKGRGLFMPLRIAITGRAWGPELADLLPLMGREEILARRP